MLMMNIPIPAHEGLRWTDGPINDNEQSSLDKIKSNVYVYS